MLHTINKSPFEKSTLNSCLRLAQEGSSILLLEDGVYAALKGTSYEDEICTAVEKFSIYALGPDLAARGMSEDRLIDGIKVVGYDGFVDLAAEADRIQSWL